MFPVTFFLLPQLVNVVSISKDVTIKINSPQMQWYVSLLLFAGETVFTEICSHTDFLQSKSNVPIYCIVWQKMRKYDRINDNPFVLCRFFIVRLSMMWDRKKRKSFVYGELIFLTEGGRSPTEVRKIKRFPFPAAFDWEISIQEQPSECYWSDTDTASSGFADLRRSKN